MDTLLINNLPMDPVDGGSKSKCIAHSEELLAVTAQSGNDQSKESSCIRKRMHIYCFLYLILPFILISYFYFVYIQNFLFQLFATVSKIISNSAFFVLMIL